MDEKEKEGYVAGAFCLLGCLFFLYLAINNAWNTTAEFLWGGTGVLGFMGGISLWKPNSAGAVVSQVLKSFAESSDKGQDSHDKKQVQKKSSGFQVMSNDQSKVNIIINPPNAQSHPPEQESETSSQEEIAPATTIEDAKRIATEWVKKEKDALEIKIDKNGKVGSYTFSGGLSVREV